MWRSIERVVRAQETAEGGGVRLKRALGTTQLGHRDPLLLLDEFKSDDSTDYQAGFPDHPHRGFKIVTYMLAGAMRHRDHLGHERNLVAGSVQWMTAGRGIVHSEMPQQTDGLLWGVQLWVNLTAVKKTAEPCYQDIAPELIPEVSYQGARVRIVAGALGGVRGPVAGVATEPIYLDLAIPAGERVTLELPADRNACCYVLEGRGEIGARDGSAGTQVGTGELTVLGNGDTVSLVATDPVWVLVLAAKPIGKQVARYGPFVMTTEEEIRQAVLDFQRGTFTEREAG